MSKLTDLLSEDRSKKHIAEIAKWIGEDRKLLSELIGYVLYSKEPEKKFRASWVMMYVCEEHPTLFQPYWGKLIKNLLKSDQHMAIVRHTLRCLQNADVPEKHLGILVDSCFKLVMNSNSSIAVKAFGLTVLGNAVKREPELARELKLVTEELMKEGGPAIQGRGRGVLELISKMKIN
jgi:hypothetical protein